MVIAHYTTENLSDGSRTSLLNQLSSLLPALQQDPTLACMLISALISPESFDFSKVLSIEPKVDFNTGLLAPSNPVNLVTLELLAKATSSSDIDTLAGMPEVVQTLVRTWLCTPEVAVHEKAQLLLERLLSGPEANVLMWRRFLGDKDVYGLIFSLCSLKTLGQDGQLDKKDKTVAQGRLLSLLPKIDNPRLRQSSCPEVEEQYDVENLLDFAALKMVDYKGDVLMYMTLMHFCKEWLRCSAERSKISDSTQIHLETPSPALGYLLEKGLHSRTIGCFTGSADLDPWDARHLRSWAAEYLEIYLSRFAEHALGLGKSIIKRLSLLFQHPRDP